VVCPIYDWLGLILENMGSDVLSALGACMKRLIGCTAAICLLALMVGCGGVTSTGTLAYISNSTGTGFTVFNVNTDATLTKSSISPQNAPTPAGDGPKVLRFAANGKWAYYLDNSGTTLYGYVRAGNGDLTTQIGTYPLSGTATALVISPNNTFLYVALRDSQRLATYSLDSATGIPTQVGSSAQIGYSITQLVMAPSGSILYALSPSQQAVLSFTLTPSSGVPVLAFNQTVGAVPDYMVLSANGSYLYVLDSQSTLPITVSTTPSCGKSVPATLQTPNIFGFTTSSTGLLTQMAGSPFNENADAVTGCYPTIPFAGATSNDTRYLFVANQGTHNVSTFKILTTPAGELSEVLNSTSIVNGVSVTVGSPFDCGSGCTTPSFVTVAKANNGLYLLDTSANKIFQYKIDQNKGTLRQQNPAFVGAEGSPAWITIR
jgi:6-phosphogluconolactonase (cycloisomerase 2 family)